MRKVMYHELAWWVYNVCNRLSAQLRRRFHGASYHLVVKDWKMVGSWVKGGSIFETET